jgi:hypothetical protein
MVRTTRTERGRLKVLPPKPGIRARAQDVIREIRVPATRIPRYPRPVKKIPLFPLPFKHIPGYPRPVKQNPRDPRPVKKNQRPDVPSIKSAIPIGAP